MSQINEMAIKSPGVYTTEIPLFPPSVAQVATAVPAFIGYTAQANRNGKNVINKAVRISSLVQYVQYFGGAFSNLSATVVINDDNSVNAVSITPKYQLFNAIQMFFNHGGANCYIIPVGLYKADGTAVMDDFIKAGETKCMEVLRKEDEPTLIVIPDAVLLGESDFNTLMNQALRQCSELQDRFTILDVLNGASERSFDTDDVITRFRNGIVGSYLNYGAAYYPWLRSNLQYRVAYTNTKIERPAGTTVTLDSIVTGNAFLAQLTKAVADKKGIIDLFIDPLKETMGNLTSKADLGDRLTEINDMLEGFISLTGFTDTIPAFTGGATLKSKFDQYVEKGSGGIFTGLEKLMRELILIDTSYPGAALGKTSAGNFAGYQVDAVAPVPGIYGNPVPADGDDALAIQNITARVKALYTNTYLQISGFKSETESMLESFEQSLIGSSTVYANIKTAIKQEGIVIPPSGAIAGIYASVDGTSGVWKAPANVAINTIIEPMVTIDNNIQDDLNIDVNAGKSINAIRSFSGKGTLVWGARTLAGNDNEWRYISVRRLFIMVEESAKKTIESFVFEANDANTWTKVRGMLENFLTSLWRQGALAGAKPEHAFFVKCGLGQTMTALDILEGRLIIEIGMAAVRPAEFIILRFSHKLQES